MGVGEDSCGGLVVSGRGEGVESGSWRERWSKYANNGGLGNNIYLSLITIIVYIFPLTYVGYNGWAHPSYQLA